MTLEITPYASSSRGHGRENFRTYLAELFPKDSEGSLGSIRRHMASDRNVPHSNYDVMGVSGRVLPRDRTTSTIVVVNRK